MWLQIRFLIFETNNINMKVAFLLFLAFFLSSQLTFHDGALTCSAGTKLAAKDGVKPKPNGCGGNKYQVKVGQAMNPFSSRFSSCCDAHDICYSTCDGSKSAKNCNSDFKSCMKKKCKKQNIFTKPLCNTYATAYYQFVDKWGEKYFNEDQKHYCTCK